jgi:hypothetical protein
MISFMILTGQPADLRDFLIARNFLKVDEAGELVGVLPGVEFAQIPNPVVTSAGPPPVYDTRKVFMVKVSDVAEADQLDTATEGELIWQRTKLGKWIRDNSTAVTHTDASGQQYRGRKVNNQPVWLFREDDAGLVGAWQ